MNPTNAAARLARIAASYSKNPMALAAFIREEREIVSSMWTFAAFNGGPSAELLEARAAFEAFTR